MQTVEEWAAQDPLQEKARIQVTDTFAALAEMKTAKGPGGDQATVEMWQNLSTQLKLKVAAHFGRYLTMPRHMNQPDTWRQVLMGGDSETGGGQTTSMSTDTFHCWPR